MFAQHLREVWDHFTQPPSFTCPEISEGTFITTMSPCPRHRDTAADLCDQLAAQVLDGIGVFESGEVGDEMLGKLRVPDIMVSAREAVPVLAVEVVSPPNPRTNYGDKTRDYPAMGIPYYLILDPRDGTWTYQREIGKRDGAPAYENR
ncbi:Uma2 family endonuclease, partial [Streptomyces sp. NPDC005538]